jgi:hypothetical protein
MDELCWVLCFALNLNSCNRKQVHFCNTKDETPKAHLENKPLNTQNSSNLNHTELNSSHKTKPTKWIMAPNFAAWF